MGTSQSSPKGSNKGIQKRPSLSQVSSASFPENETEEGLQYALRRLAGASNREASVISSLSPACVRNEKGGLRRCTQVVEEVSHDGGLFEHKIRGLGDFSQSGILDNCFPVSDIATGTPVVGLRNGVELQKTTDDCKNSRSTESTAAGCCEVWDEWRHVMRDAFDDTSAKDGHHECACMMEEPTDDISTNDVGDINRWKTEEHSDNTPLTTPLITITPPYTTAIMANDSEAPEMSWGGYEFNTQLPPSHHDYQGVFPEHLNLVTEGQILLQTSKEMVYNDAKFHTPEKSTTYFNETPLGVWADEKFLTNITNPSKTFDQRGQAESEISVPVAEITEKVELFQDDGINILEDETRNILKPDKFGESWREGRDEGERSTQEVDTPWMPAQLDRTKSPMQNILDLGSIEAHLGKQELEIDDETDKKLPAELVEQATLAEGEHKDAYLSQQADPRIDHELEDSYMHRLGHLKPINDGSDGDGDSDGEKGIVWERVQEIETAVVNATREPRLALVEGAGRSSAIMGNIDGNHYIDGHLLVRKTFSFEKVFKKLAAQEIWCGEDLKEKDGYAGVGVTA